MQRAQLARPPRVLVYSHRLPSVSALSESLARRGVEVRAVSDFQELCAWLVCWRGTPVALVDMPHADILREAMTKDLHRIDPGLPIAPIDPGDTADRMTRVALRLLAADHPLDDADDDQASRQAA